MGPLERFRLAARKVPFSFTWTKIPICSDGLPSLAGKSNWTRLVSCSGFEANEAAIKTQ